MDAENDNDQPNSSSASASSSSSNNSSSSNLLGHLPMLPFMRSTDDDEPVADHLADGNVDHHHNNDVNNDLNEEPMPLQPPPAPVTQAMAMATAAQPASASVLQPTMAPITTTATAATGAGTSTASSTSSVGREEPMVGAEQLAVLSSSSSASSLPLPQSSSSPTLPPPLSSASSSSTSTSYFATTSSSSHTTTRLPPSAILPSANPSQVIFSPFLFDMPAAISTSTHAHDFNKSLSSTSSLQLPSPFSPTISSQTFTHLMSPMSDSNTPPLLTSSSPSSSVATSSSSPSSSSAVHQIHYNLAQSQLSLFHEQDPIPTTSFSISSQQQQQLSPHQASSPPPQPPPTPPQPTSASTIIESTTVVQSQSPASSLLLQHNTEHAAPGQSQQQGQVVEQQQLTAQIINRNDIADTIDASAVIVQPLETNAEEIGHQPHIYPQEAASEAEVEQQQQQQQNNIQLDDNDNNDFDVDLNIRNDEAVAVVASSSSSASVAAAVAQQQQQQHQLQRTQSLTLDTSASGSAGPSSSTSVLGQQQQQQTPQLPTTLPLLLQQQQQQQPPPLQQQSEESKHLPSFDHHYHNPREFHLHAHPYQHPCVYPYGFRSNSPSHNNNNNNTNGAHISSGSSLNTNNIMFGNSMSSDHRNHHGSSTSGLGGVVNTNSSPQVVDRLKMLYPNVNENETPLPRCWSPHDKCLSIGLSQNNLRVHFKGIGKQSNDAASVRTAHPIPPACGIYYFEVEIISKGKNGYMGIGLTAQQFRMNRLPGWDKQSYGYHGDDGNSFSSSGHGQSYGPTFTTGDVIGCCVNFVNNTCFYTKNGIDLGIAFRDLPNKLYPTVGLQTPGEEVDANFGQEPFKFDQIEDMMKQMRAEMTATIYDFPLPAEQGDPTTLLQKLVSSYLVHNGYSQTAEAFSRQKTGQNLREDISSIRNRQRILKLVMAGKIGQAIEQTLRSYPGLLENNKNLWFMLKIRQFIEMINGSDIEYCPTSSTITTTSTNKTPCTHSITTQTSSISLDMSSVPQQTSVIQSTKSYQNGNGGGIGVGPSTSSNGSLLTTNLEDHPSTSGSTIAVTKQTTTTASTNNTTNLNNNNNSNNNTTSANNLTIAATVANSPAAVAAVSSSSSSVETNTVAAAATITTPPAAAATATTIINAQNSSHMTVIHTDNDIKTQTNLVEHCSATNDAPSTIDKSNNDNDYLNDVEMENNGQHTTNGNGCKNGNTNNFNDSIDADEEMDVDVSPAVKNFSHGIERILEFGKELSKMGTQLDKEKKMSDDEKRMMENAFSLIAYSNPWASPLGWQLCPSKREPVCRALNSAILESMNYPKMPPLEYCVAHANELLKVMAQASLGACAFVNIADVFPKN